MTQNLSRNNSLQPLHKLLSTEDNKHYETVNEQKSQSTTSSWILLSTEDSKCYDTTPDWAFTRIKWILLTTWIQSICIHDLLIVSNARVRPRGEKKVCLSFPHVKLLIIGFDHISFFSTFFQNFWYFFILFF